MPETCPDCNGRGTISFGTEDMECATCNGKGKVTPKVAKQAEKAIEERLPTQP